MEKRGTVLFRFCIVLAIGLASSIILYLTMWERNITAVHTLLEGACIFIGASTFLVIWNTIDKIPRINNIIGFGFLFVVVFDAYHTYIYVAQSAIRDNLLDLSMRSWILGRLAQAIVLYLATLKIRAVKINKWFVLVAVMFLSFGINTIALYFPEVFPVISTTAGLTPVKILIELIVIAFTILTIMNVIKSMDDETSTGNRHLFTALLLIIPAEIMFTIYSSEHSFAFVYGHVLKLLYYYFIYRSIYVGSIRYPFEKMKNENRKLEEAYRQLEENRQEEARRQNILIQQEKLAMLGQMGAGIVHETRNYLTTIKGSCQLAELLTKEEGLLRHIKKINKSVDEIDKIISKFLFMSKPRDTEFEEISMYDLSQSVESLIISTSLTKRADICFKTSKQERYLLCDEGQINQVVLNLCKNAVEAMEGMVDAKLTVETGYDEASNEIYISVRDNGIGISPCDLKKIGQPFFTTKDTGTGLGLYVCNEMIKEHKGKIEIDSILGKGTNFTIRLPCLKEDREESAENKDNVC